MMCPSYSLTSQRTETLLNSDRKLVLRYNVWHTAGARPPWSPCPSKLMDTNVSPHENVSWNRKKKMESQKYRKMERENGAKMTHKFIRGVLKWEEREFLKMSVFFRCLLPAEKRSSTESITSLSRAVFSEHAKKRNIKSLLLSFLSIFFPSFFQTPCIWKQPSKGKRFFHSCPWRHVRGLGVSALFSGARHFLLQMKTKTHPPGWIINNTQT